MRVLKYTICYLLTIDLLDIEDESFDSKQHSMLQLCNIVLHVTTLDSTSTEERNKSWKDKQNVR